MSTNYYAYKKIPTGVRRRELINAIDALEERMYIKEIIEKEDNPKIISEKIENYIEHLSKIHEAVCEKPVHLGKQSVGWQFLWQVYPDGNGSYKYYEPNLKSIKAFLYDVEHWMILDEYSREMSPDEFFRSIRNTLYKTPELYNNESYYRDFPQHKTEFTDYFLKNEHQSEDGLRYTTDEFS